MFSSWSTTTLVEYHVVKETKLEILLYTWRSLFQSGLFPKQNDDESTVVAIHENLVRTYCT